MSPTLQELYTKMVDATREYSLAQTKLCHHKVVGLQLETEEQSRKYALDDLRDQFQKQILLENTTPEERIRGAGLW